MVMLVQKELCDHALMLTKDSEGVLSLVTLKARREGEELCPLRGLLYDSLTALESFLSEGGNKVLADRLIRVDGVADDTGGVSPVYMAVTGVGRFLRHFTGVRRSGPNAIINVDCSKGASDGFLSLVVSTRTKIGIAARSPVCINFGNKYDMLFKADSEEPEAKKFCGTLDKYFQKAIDSNDLTIEADEEATKKEEEQKKKAEEEAKKKQEDEAKKKQEEEAKKKTGGGD